jgi:hypothetical protein
MYEVKRVEQALGGFHWPFNAITIRTGLHSPLDASVEAVNLWEIILLIAGN